MTGRQHLHKPCRVPIREHPEETFPGCIVVLLLIFYFSVAYHILYDNHIC